MATATKQRTTFNQLVKLEPKLGELLKQAQAVKDDGSQEYYCGNAVWFGWDNYPGFKRSLCALVGWDRLGDGDPVLFSSDSYEVAYKTIYNALPYCRGECRCG
jgi:hypothetical protein